MGKVSEKSSYKNKQAAERSTRFFTARQAEKGFFKSKPVIKKEVPSVEKKAETVIE